MGMFHNPWDDQLVFFCSRQFQRKARESHGGAKRSAEMPGAVSREVTTIMSEPVGNTETYHFGKNTYKKKPFRNDNGHMF